MDGLIFRDVLAGSRKAAGWTQEDLAERSGVSVRTIRNLEAGVIANPRRASVDLLLTALGVAAGRVHLTAAAAPGAGPSGAGPSGSPVIGRDTDIACVLAAVQRFRVVVLTGPGGVGKTRLMEEVAARAGPSLGLGVAVAEMGRLDPDQAGCPSAREQVRATVTAALDLPPARRASAGLLLLIDNAEHVLASLTRLVAEVTAELPQVHVLITSRQVLPMISAYHWDVKPLPTEPDEAGQLPAAAELFLRRAEVTCPTLDLSAHLPAVTELCRRLDGIPLALELAAARIRSVSLDTMLAGEPISQLLGRSSTDGLPHQRSIADSVRWSYDLLDDRQRGVLHDLARFAGLFTVEDMQRGPWQSAPDARSLISALGELVDASLVQVRRSTQYYYRLTSLVREFVEGRPLGTNGPQGALFPLSER